MYYNGSLATAEGSALVETAAWRLSCVIGMVDTFHTITPQMHQHITQDTEVYPHVAGIEVHIWFHWTCNQAVRDSK